MGGGGWGAGWALGWVDWGGLAGLAGWGELVAGSVGWGVLRDGGREEANGAARGTDCCQQLWYEHKTLVNSVKGVTSYSKHAMLPLCR